jgi:hypothetical protein
MDYRSTIESHSPCKSMTNLPAMSCVVPLLQTGRTSHGIGGVAVLAYANSRPNVDSAVLGGWHEPEQRWRRQVLRQVSSE